MTTSFHHRTPVQIRFSDADAMNHVNNAKYLTYMELARIAYFREVLGKGVDYSKTSFILAKAVVDFLLPLSIDDTVEVRTRCARIGNKSFVLEYEIARLNTEPHEVVAKAETVLVTYDYENQRSIPIPPGWKQRIEAYEQQAIK